MQKHFSSDSNQKWACSACTYLNWPKTVRCVQCETSRENADITTDHDESSGGCSGSRSCSISDDATEGADFEDQFASVYICDLNDKSTEEYYPGTTAGLKSSTTSPVISSFYITQPSSSSRIVTKPCNTMFIDEDNDCRGNGSNTSALNNTLNTTNSLRNEKSTPVITDNNQSLSMKHKQDDAETPREVIMKNESSPAVLSKNLQQKYKQIQQNCNNLIEKQPSNKFAEETNPVTSGAPNFSTIHRSNDSPQNLSNSNKHLSSAGATTKSTICNNSISRDSDNVCTSTKTSTSSTSTNFNTDKWACGVCTFDNWPRSMKCVMCLTPRINLDVGETFHSRVKPTRKERLEVLNQNDESILPVGNRNNDLGHHQISQVQLGNNHRSVELTSLQPANNRISTSGSNIIGSSPLNNRRTMETDARWLEACHGVVEGNIIPVEQYLAAGGDPARQLSQFEVALLNRPSAFDIGFTLVHLAIRFHQEQVLAVLLSQVGNEPSVVKRVPSYAAPDLAMDIRRLAMASLRQRKGSFHCYYTSDVVTFILPSEILDLRPDVQETLFNEILDRDVQKELESQIINWSVELMGPLSSRLYALWNRSAGDCLLDSVLQATWGIFDRDNGLRRALADSLHECATIFYQRWKENELLHAHNLDFSLNDSQCATDWAKLLSIASKPGSSLEQLHIFALSHILRRPIIVYGVKYVKSFRGETLGFARYEGVYLPFLWDPAFCWKWPIALGYTRGHFSALVGIEPDCVQVPGASAPQLKDDHLNRSIFLPLNSIDGTLLPIHFLAKSEIGKEEMILSQWLDVRFIESGVMVACQRIQKQPLLVGQMVDEWLNHYRRLGQITSAPYIHPPTATCYSSDESDD